LNLVIRVSLTWSLGPLLYKKLCRPPFYFLYIYFFTSWLHTCAINWIKTVICQGNYSFVLFPFSWFAHDMLFPLKLCGSCSCLLPSLVAKSCWLLLLLLLLLLLFPYEGISLFIWVNSSVRNKLAWGINQWLWLPSIVFKFLHPF
jgi:hypothetical protein